MLLKLVNFWNNIRKKGSDRMHEILEQINNYYNTIAPYTSGIGAFSSTMIFVNNTYKKLKSYIDINTYDINEIFKGVKNQTIEIGSYIDTYGFLLDYAQIFKPYTHTNGMFDLCKNGETGTNFKDGKLLKYSSMSMGYKILQPPIQKIPPMNNIGCAFLYDTRFKGFHHEQNTVNSESSIKPVLIDEYAKPILIIYDVNKYKKYINKDVKVRARVIELPLDLVEKINGISDNTIKEICSNYIDMYSENYNFICLAVVEDGQIREIDDIKSLQEWKAPLYVEAELENLDKYCHKDSVKNFLEQIVPNLPQKLDSNFPLNVANVYGDLGLPFISTTDINVIFREPNIVGFYTDVHIYDDEEYSNKLEEYTTLVNNFAVDYRNKMKRNFGKKESMKLNFLFDYNKQLLFDTRGVLYSNAVKELAELDESQKYVQEWLRNGVKI